MVRIIFLDIEGVLDSGDGDRIAGERASFGEGELSAAARIDPVRVARLNQLVEATGAEIVLSSSWRKLFALDRIGAALRAKGLAHPIGGSTPPLIGEERHVEINAYLERLSEPAAFVILDDGEEAGVGFDEHFVHVAGGLEDEHVEHACRILSPEG